MTVDRRGDLYISYVGWLCCPSVVDEIKRHTTWPVVLGIAATSEPNAKPFLSLTMDAEGDLVAADDVQLSTYEPSAIAWPEVQAATASFGARGTPEGLAFNRDRSRLFVADALQNAIIEYDYPSGQVANIFSNTIFGPTAVAVGPLGRLPVRNPQPASPKPPTLKAGTISESQTNGAVYALDARRPNHGSPAITGIDMPLGLAVDALENLYVVESSPASVLVYPKGATQPSESYSNGLSQPTAVAVGPDQTIAVTNCVICQSAPGQLVIYPQGQMAPTVLEGSGNERFLGVSLDSAENAYTVFYSGEVLEYPSAKGYSKEPVGLLDVSSGLQWVALDPYGDVVSLDGPGVGVYASGPAIQNMSSGPEYRQIKKHSRLMAPAISFTCIHIQITRGSIGFSGTRVALRRPSPGNGVKSALA